MPIQIVEPLDPKASAEYLRDSVLSFLKTELPKPWQMMNEQEQERVVSRIESLCRNSVTNVVAAISQVGRMTVPAMMGPLSTDKKGNPKVPVTFELGLNDDEKLAIWDHIGRQVVVVLMDSTEFQNYSKKADVDKDEPTLPLAQAPGQPDWPAVLDAVTGAVVQPGTSDTVTVSRDGQTIKEPALDDDDDFLEIPANMRRSTEPTPDDHDAGDAMEDESAVAEDSLIDDEMEPAQIARMVDIPNPTKPKVDLTKKK